MPGKMGTRQQLCLSGLLQATGPDGSDTAEALYWASSEVQSFLERLDGYALLAVLGNNLGLLLYTSSSSSSSSSEPVSAAAAAAGAGGAGDVRWGIQLVVLLAAAQFMLRLLRADACRKHRHSLALGNRIVRLGLHVSAAMQQSFNVMGQKFLQEEHSLHAVLARRLAFCPLMQLQISFNFSLPMRTAVLLQPLNALVAAFMGYNAPQMLAAVPGMEAIAGQLCGLCAAWHELVLFALTLGACPPVNQVSSSCSGPLAFNQLLVFTNLLCSLWLPLYVAHMVELHAKICFWQARGMEVVPARSLLLPLPKQRLLSHVLVGLLAPTLLWSLAELLAPVLAAVVGA